MGKKLKQIGEIYGIPNIEERRKEYGDKINLEYYPTINNFTSVSHYESYIEKLILDLRKELSNSKDELAKLTITFKLDRKDKFLEMSFIQFVYNILLWRPFIEFNVPVTKDDLFTSEIFHNNKYSEFINRFVDKNRNLFTMAEISECLMRIQHDFNQLAIKVGPIFGLSLSIYDMIKMAKRNNEVASIINADVSLEGSNVSEIEDFLKSQSERLMNILANEDDKNNPLKPFIRSKTGINSYQLRSNFINIGFKPSASSGKTIPIVSTSSLVDKGISTAEDLFIDSSGGRLAALFNRKVDQYGYLSRHLTLSSSDVTLHPDPNYSCDTVNLYTTTIKSQRELDALDGRFMKVGEKKFKIIRNTDVILIGKTVELRTPTTCASKEGICKVCYGTLYNVNLNINAGLYAAVTLSEASTQTGLSCLSSI